MDPDSARSFKSDLACDLRHLAIVNAPYEPSATKFG